MDNGLYRTKDGEIVVVTATETGYLIRYSDGRAVVVSR